MHIHNIINANFNFVELSLSSYIDMKNFLVIPEFILYIDGF